jgi:capsular exopolysaccharide synthesis family protein
LTNLVLALVGGTIAGLGLAMLMHQLDGALKNPADIEGNLGLPMLGVIPRDEFGDLLTTLGDRKSVLAESYQSVLTSLRFSTTHGVPRSFAVTSANASEGKSTTALSIAVILARTGRKVLILDADMRNPSLHKLIGVTNSYGTANLLAGDSVRDVKPYAVGDDGLMGVPAGPIPPNPAELLGTDHLHNVLDELLAIYDHVIVDAPPVMGLSDAPLISSAVEAVVFVVTAGSTGKKSAVASLRRLQEAGANIIGAVLSRYASTHAGYGYSYNYTYSYGAKNNPKANRASSPLDIFRKKK